MIHAGESAESARITLTLLWPALPREEHGHGPWYGGK